MIRWLFLLLGDFESGLERLLIFSSALLFVMLHFLFCAEDAVYIGANGLEFFVIILEIMLMVNKEAQQNRTRTVSPAAIPSKANYRVKSKKHL